MLNDPRFKTEYISELMITGYTQEEAEEQYQLELKAIEAFNFNAEDDEY